MIGILSDVHGNLPALKAVLGAAIGMGCSRFISLGDVVGYYAQPGECIDLLREHEVINLMGNHDHYMVEGLACPRSRVVSEIMTYQRCVVTPGQVEWLAGSLPLLVQGPDHFVHGGCEDPRDQYLYRVDEACIPPQARRLFSGHTHVQVLADFGTRQYCNPGSVGQPRDGDPRAAFAVLADDSVTLHRVAYDIDATAAAMKAAGFPPHYAECLYIGAQIGGRIDRVAIERNHLPEMQR